MDGQFTGDLWTDQKILNIMDDDALFNFLQTSKIMWRLCDDNFWKQRYTNQFPTLKTKPENISYKEHYYLEYINISRYNVSRWLTTVSYKFLEPCYQSKSIQRYVLIDKILAPI